MMTRLLSLMMLALPIVAGALDVQIQTFDGAGVPRVQRATFPSSRFLYIDANGDFVAKSFTAGTDYVAPTGSIAGTSGINTAIQTALDAKETPAGAQAKADAAQAAAEATAATDATTKADAAESAAISASAADATTKANAAEADANTYTDSEIAAEIVRADAAYDASGSASAAQAFAIQRANHTGTQLLSTISDVTANGALLAKIGTPTVRGVDKAIHIAIRTDGLTGSGTAEDPFDGSTQAKFDALITTATGRHYVLGPGTFRTNGIRVRSGCRISGAGEGVTTIKLADGIDIVTNVYTTVVEFWDQASTHSVVENLTVDGNWSTLYSSGSAAVQGINGRGSNLTVRNVRVTNCGGQGNESFICFLGSVGDWPSEGYLIENVTVDNFWGNSLTAIGFYNNQSDGRSASGVITNCVVRNTNALTGGIIAYGGFGVNGMSVSGSTAWDCVYGFNIDSNVNSNIELSGVRLFGCASYGIVATGATDPDGLTVVESYIEAENKNSKFVVSDADNLKLIGNTMVFADPGTGSGSDHLDIATASLVKVIGNIIGSGAGLNLPSNAINAFNTDESGVLSSPVGVEFGGTGSSDLTGILKGNGSSPISQAVAGTDYLEPSGNGGSLTGITSSQINGTPTERGIEKTIYVAIRTDGLAGSGTAEDPFDGSNASKVDAILENLAENTSVRFSAGLFELNSDVDNLADGCAIIGSGMHLTTLKMVNGSSSGMHCVLRGTADDVVISDLTVDANWDGQSFPSDSKVGGISIVGSNNLVHRVRVINTRGSLSEGLESFDIYLRGTNAENNWVRECIVEDFAGDYHSAILIGGTTSGNSTGGGIENCTVRGCPFASLGVSSSNGAVIRGNYMEDCAYMVRIDTSTVYDLTICENYGDVSAAAVYLDFVNNAPTPPALWADGIVIVNNNISLTGSVSYGVRLMGGSADNNVGNILVADNVFRFLEGTSGAIVSKNSAYYQNVVSERNASGFLKTLDGYTGVQEGDFVISDGTTSGRNAGVWQPGALGDVGGYPVTLLYRFVPPDVNPAVGSGFVASGIGASVSISAINSMQALFNVSGTFQLSAIGATTSDFRRYSFSNFFQRFGGIEVTGASVFEGDSTDAPVTVINGVQIAASEWTLTTGGTVPNWSASTLDSSYMFTGRNWVAGKIWPLPPIIGALSIDEAKEWTISRTLPAWALIGGSATSQTSGSLIVGAKYQITASGGTFTGVGSSDNNVGTIFLATGTSPTWGTGGVIRWGALGMPTPHPDGTLSDKLGRIVGTFTGMQVFNAFDGEYLSASLASGSSVSLTTATTANVTSVSLTPGDWDVSGVIDFAMTGATATKFRAGVSTTSATMGAQDSYIQIPVSFSGLSDTFSDALPTVRLSLASTTTVYLVADSTFSLGSVSAYGTIRARRIR